MFLYYAQAINCTMLTALSAIATEQAAPTATTLKNKNQFFDYAATNNKAVLTYKASNMVLAVHSNDSYLNEPQARSSTSNKSSHVICSVGRAGSIIHQHKIGRPHQAYTQRTRPTPATNVDTNRQLNHIWCCNKQNHPKGDKSNGYALPLITQQRTAAEISFLLATGKNELC